MDMNNDTLPQKENPPSIVEVTNNIRLKNESITDFCCDNDEENFYCVEKSLKSQIYQLSCMYLQLYLLLLQDKFDYSHILECKKYYKGDLLPRTLKTTFGKVRLLKNLFHKKTRQWILSF